MDVVVHNAISVDGRIDGFVPNVSLYYELAGTWETDAHLVGADTLIEGERTSDADPEFESGSPEAPTETETQPEDDEVGESPLLVVTDSRGRVAGWPEIRQQPLWRDVLVLCSDATPESYREDLSDRGIEYVVAGEDRVDLQESLDILGERGIETVLVDSGGSLNGALLRAGLVTEVSILVHPVAIGGTSARSFLRGPDPDDGATSLELRSVERFEDDLLWIRYDVTNG